MAANVDNSQKEFFDIASFVQHYESIKKLCSPFIKIYYFSHNIIKFRSPKQAGILWLFSLLLCLFPSGYLICLLQMYFLLLIGFGLFQYKFKIFKKVYPDYVFRFSDESTKDKKNVSEVINDFRKSLFEIDLILTNACKCLHLFFSILRWDDPHLSFWIIVGLSSFSLCAYFIGLSLAMFIMLSTYFIFMQYCYPQASTDQIDGNYENFEEIRNEEFSSMSNSNASSLKFDEGNDEEDYVNSESNGESLKYKTPFVKSFMKFRKRNKQVETCTSCQTNLTSFLKRSHVCMNCAQVFCHKCCTLQVPKSVLGVTDPATCNDVVPICFSCHQSFCPDWTAQT